MPSGFLTAGILGKFAGLGDLSSGREEDSCARVFVTNAGIINMNAIKPKDNDDAFTKEVVENFISSLRGTQYLGEILCEARARHHLVATGISGLLGQFSLHVRKKCHYANIF